MYRGGQRSKCPEMWLFIYNHVWMIYLDGSWSLGPKGPPQWLDRNPGKILALSFHITGHHAPSRTSSHPKTRQEDFLYDTKSSWDLKSRFGEGWFSTFLAPLLLIFSKWNGPKWRIWPTTGSFLSVFVAMIFIYQKNAIYLKWSRLVQ